jgi:hypothetical protein
MYARIKVSLVVGVRMEKSMDSAGAAVKGLGDAYILYKLLPIMIAVMVLTMPFMNAGMVILTASYDSVEKQVMNEVIRIQGLGGDHNSKLLDLKEKFNDYQSAKNAKYEETFLGGWIFKGIIFLAVCFLVYKINKLWKFMLANREYLFVYVIVCILNGVSLFTSTSQEYVLFYRPNILTYISLISFGLYWILLLLGYFGRDRSN